MSETTALHDLTNSIPASLDGRIVTPDSPEYEERCRVWNGMIERRPAAFVVARSTRDVIAGVAYARDNGLPLTVCGGGHNVAGNALNDGGVVIDLREMRGVEIDPVRRIARVQGGAMLGDVDTAAQEHGLAVPVGVASETGIAGLTLGGGLGWLRRRYGLTSDNLLAAEVVLADGDVIRATEDEHADLLWLLRGGGSCPGVVTEFEFRAYPVGPDIDLTFRILPIEQAREGLRLFREFAPSAPDDLSMFAILQSVPAIPEIEERYHHQQCLIFLAAWTGDREEGERVTAPLREFGDAIADLSGPIPYLEMQAFFDPDYPKGNRYYWKSRYLDGITDEAIEMLVETAGKRPSGESTLDLWQLGGAVARVEPEATAYPHRSAPYLLGIEANWHDPADDEANVAWAREVFARSEPFAEDGGLYVNFPGFGEEQAALVRKALGKNYDRAVAVHGQYDPERVFAASAHIRVV